MFNNENNIEILKKALAVIAEEEAATLPSEEECADVTFSEEFLRKMQRLIKLRKKSYYRFINTVGKRIACIVIAILLALTTVTFSVKGLREAVVEFFVQTFEKFSVIGVDDTAADITEIETYYAPTYMPDGFSLREELKTDNLLHLKYSNGGKFIYFLQGIIGDGGHYIDTESSEGKEIYVNGHKGYMSKKGDTTFLYWNNDTYSFMVTTVGLEESETFRIAEAVEKK